jgi:nitronate monooxygenase
VDRLRDDIAKVRALTTQPVGVNIFVPGEDDADETAVARYALTLQPDVQRLGIALGEPRFEDDHYAQKVALVRELRPAVVSFTFGCPSALDVANIKDAGVEVWVTVTNPDEADIAAAAGADALVVQGSEAGGHRSYFTDDDAPDLVLLGLLAAVRECAGLPLIAAGGVSDRAGVLAALAAGATGVQVGTALMLTPEAGTAPVHRAAFASDNGTRLTRVFTGRTARGIVNRFMDDHDADAVRAYPQIHHLTQPLRAAAKVQGESSVLHLWAGQGYQQARPEPAGQVVADLAGMP